MRIGIITQTIWERLALALGRIPEPVVEVFPPLVLARSIMAATRLGIFDVLAHAPQTSDDLAALCHTEPRATAALLEVLVSAGYLSEERSVFRLTRKARHWLCDESPASVSAYIRFNYLQWTWLGELERFAQTGVPIAFHEQLSGAEWQLYEHGMASIARLTLPEVVWRVPVPANATALLDLGGGHSLAAAYFCRRHADIHATVLDLPEALASAPLLPADLADASKRITRVAGDALTADLGIEAYDVIYIANLLHHFDSSAIESLAARIATALRPGGIWVIQDGVRERRRRSQRMPATIGDLYFALTSASGFRSFPEMAAWQARAGLFPRRPIRLLTAPGQGLQIAAKPRRVGGRG